MSRIISFSVTDTPTKDDEVKYLTIVMNLLPNGYLKDMLETLRPVFKRDVESDLPTDGPAVLDSLAERARELRAECDAASKALEAKQAEMVKLLANHRELTRLTDAARFAARKLANGLNNAAD